MGNQLAAPTAKSALFFPELQASLPRMEGKTVAITGCTSGTGQVLAMTCGQLGAKVLMLNRPSSRADKALSDMKEKGYDAVTVNCDLQSFDSVRKAAADVQAIVGTNGLDVLCNNAGVMGLLDQATPDGFDVQMQSNHLSHFLLTSLLWPQLEQAANRTGESRVVNHSSGARNAKPLDYPMLPQYLQRNGGNLGGDGFPGHQKWVRYQQTKLANLLFTYALQARATERGSKVKCICAHPGPTDTSLQGKSNTNGGTRYLDVFILNSAIKNAHAVEDGAMGIVIGSCQPGVEGGSFYGPPGKGKGGKAVLLPAERNPEQEKLLWEESLKSCGLTSFF